MLGLDEMATRTMLSADLDLQSRPLKISSNSDSGQLSVVTSKPDLINKIKARLAAASEDFRHQVNVSKSDIIRMPYHKDTLTILQLPDGIQADAQVTVSYSYFDDYDIYLQYMFLHHYLRTFNYGNKKETKKIADKRVGDFLNEDVRELRKLIETFGGDVSQLDKYGRK